MLRAAASARLAHRHLVVCAVTALTLLVLAAPAVAKPPTVFNPIVEAQNFSITQQRQAIYDTPVGRMFSGTGVINTDGTEWYFPTRLTLDMSGVGNGTPSAAQPGSAWAARSAGDSRTVCSCTASAPSSVTT